MNDTTLTLSADNIPDAMLSAALFCATDGQNVIESYRAMPYLREDYVYTGLLLWAPYWHAGEVLGWAAARVQKITVSVTNGVADAWVVVRYADGTEKGHFLYALARWTSVATWDATPLPRF